MSQLLIDEDFNGDCFVLGGSGEREEKIANRWVYFFKGIPFEKGKAFDPKDADHKKHLGLLLKLNYWYHIQNTSTDKSPNVSDSQAAISRKVAYVRTLAARNGNYHFNGTISEHHVQYSDCVQVDDAEVAKLISWVTGKKDVTVAGLDDALSKVPDIPKFTDDRDWQRNYMPKHMDVVCCIAYMFRVRAHHWMADMDERYESLFRKCLYDEGNPGIEWQHLAHDSLHAIFPDDLDNIWKKAVKDGKCAGALVKRWDSHPAGIAGLAALNAGVADVRLVVPKALDLAKDAIKHLDEVNAIANIGRWNGSVNRRFYLGKEIVVDESKLSTLAAVIRGGLEYLAGTSPLLKSKALARIAANAPITAGMIGRSMLTATRSDAAANLLVTGLQGDDDSDDDDD